MLSARGSANPRITKIFAYRAVTAFCRASLQYMHLYILQDTGYRIYDTRYRAVSTFCRASLQYMHLYILQDTGYRT